MPCIKGTNRQPGRGTVHIDAGPDRRLLAGSCREVLYPEDSFQHELWKRQVPHHAISSGQGSVDFQRLMNELLADMNESTMTCDF